MFINVCPLSFCEPCVHAKMKAIPFQNQGQRATRPRQVICYDITGPYQKTPGGFQYGVHIIDKFSGYPWYQPAKSKAEAAQIILDHISSMDCTGEPVLATETFVSDAGGEIISNEFEANLLCIGIFHVTSPRGQSNYNSIIERSIQTKLNMAFSMLDASPLSSTSTGWNLVMAHATFIQARCPLRSNPGNITLYENVFGFKADTTSL